MGLWTWLQSLLFGGREARSPTALVAVQLGDAAFNLYALRDPTWKPTYANANTSAFMMGSAGRPEDVVRR